jgi:predicted membrane channel-forming protein YqfA (hemolysin III family)
MRLIKKIIAYATAIIIVVVLRQIIEAQFETNEKVAVLVTGVIFAIGGIWLMFKPRSAMRRYHKSQQIWHRRLPNLTKALEDVGDINKELTDTVYSSPTKTHVLGFLAFVLGLIAVLAVILSA